MRKFFDAVDWMIKYILFILLGVMLVVAFLQVIYRSVMEISVSWTDELTRYLFIWLIFVGTSFSIRRSSHISIETIYLVLKDKHKDTYRKIIYGVQLAFFVAVFFFATDFMLSNFTNVSPSLQLPMGFVYLSLPVGCILSSLFIIEKLFFGEKGVPEE